MQSQNAMVENLNKQMSLELTASHVYLQFSIWCEIYNYKGFAKYFLEASNEERAHAMMVKDYCVDLIGANDSGYLQLDALQLAPELDSILDAFEQSLELEIKVTESINQNILEAMNAGDFSTMNFFLPMASEQTRGLQEVRYILSKIKSCGDDFAAIMMLDEEVGEIK